MQQSSKLLDVLKSQNFFIAVVTIIMAAFMGNSIQFNFTAFDVVTLFKTNTLLSITVLSFLYQVVVNLYSHLHAQPWTWAFLRSANFVAGLISLLSVVLTAYFGDMTAGVIVSVVTQILNSLWHIALPVGQNAQFTI